MVATCRLERSHQVEALFPDGVAGYQIRGCADAVGLYAEEAEACRNASSKRLAEFAGGRACARAALSALGFEPVALPMNDDRSPRWPASAVGSITHSSGVCMAVVGRRSQYASLGLDTECVSRVSADLWPQVLTESEMLALARLCAEEKQQVASVMFSAKEATYKCRHPLTGGWLGFDEAAVEVEIPFQAEGRLRVRVCSEVDGPRTFAGRFSVTGDTVVTGVALTYGEPA